MSATVHVFRLPDLGEGLTEAEIVSWHVTVGDEVGIDQEVVTVETAKAAVDVPCPYAGRVTALHAEPGTVLPVGEPLITVGSAGEDGSRPAGAEQYRNEERAGTDPDQPERPLIGYGAGDGPARRSGGRRRRAAGGSAPASSDTINIGAGQPSSSSQGSTTVAVRVISPLVRRLAREWGLDLATVRPGPTGVIRKADLEAARAAAVQEKTSTAVPSQDPAAPTVPAGGRRIPIQGVHRVMVDRLSTSRREIPDATTWVDVDATRLIKARDALRRTRPEAGIGTLALLARITVAGLAAYPALNSSVDLEAGEIVEHDHVHLGFAAQSPRGLVVPVVRDAQRMSTAELAAALRQLTEKAREGRLAPAELTGGTFTLNNYGVFGVDGSTPILNHPEAAMLGVGRITDKPWVHQGRLKVRKVTQLSFTFDHRVCDGGTAGGFLRFVADRVEQPSTLLADL